MATSLTVHLLSDFDSDWQAQLRSKLNPAISLSVGKETSEVPEYKILIAGRPERSHFDRCPACDTLVIPFAGMPAQTRVLMRELPHIAVHNLHHNSAPTAELAVALMMAAAKRIVNTDAGLRKNVWRISPTSEELLLQGRTVVVLGFGAIGRRVARVCESLGMNVIGLKRRKGEPQDGRVRVATIDELDELLPSANVLFISLPLTDRTEGLLDKRRLSLLPDNAIIVNVARGAIIKEKALFRELKSERIRAGLDVWYRYPKSEDEYADCQPSEYPFGELRNVVMTPHIGGDSDRTEELRIEHLARMLNDAAVGKPMPNRVDVDAGY